MNPTIRRLLLLLLALPLSGLATHLCAQRSQSKSAFTIVIDAGHGGHDPGALGAYSREKDINLNVALALGQLIADNCPDVKVVYTRQSDRFIPLERRAEIANNNHADLFLSIHTNALPLGRIAYGSETYTLGMARANANLAVAKRENSVITLENDYQHTYAGFDPNKAESYVIFEILQDRYMKQSVDLASAIQRQYKSAGRPDKGVHQAGFLVLRNTTMPSVLTELGFITTPAEETYLNSQRGIEELSRSLYNGFLTYRRQHDKTAHTLPANLPTHIEQAANQPPINLSTTPTYADRTTDPQVTPMPAIPTQQVMQQRREQQLGGDQREANSTPATADERAKAIQPKATQPQAAKPKAAKSETTQPKAAKPATAKPKVTSTAKKPEPPKAPKVTYRIQVGAGRKAISPTDAQFKGLPIKREQSGTLYRYFTGTYTTFAEANRALATVKQKLPGAYLIATLDGKEVAIKEARQAEKR